MPDYKPSAVNILGTFPPLCATFDKTEGEVMAALICRALSVVGDEWRPIGLLEVRAVLAADIAAAEGNPKAPALSRLIFDLSRNPFTRPDPHELVNRGFATWTRTDEPGGLLAFTDAGFERLRKWVR